MKKADLQNLREKNEVDLKNDLLVEGDNLWRLKNDLASGKVKNVSEIRKIKNRIAITKTLIKEKTK